MQPHTASQQDPGHKKGGGGAKASAPLPSPAAPMSLSESPRPVPGTSSISATGVMQSSAYYDASSFAAPCSSSSSPPLKSQPTLKNTKSSHLAPDQKLQKLQKLQKPKKQQPQNDTSSPKSEEALPRVSPLPQTRAASSPAPNAPASRLSVFKLRKLLNLDALRPPFLRRSTNPSGSTTSLSSPSSPCLSSSGSSASPSSASTSPSTSPIPKLVSSMSVSNLKKGSMQQLQQRSWPESPDTPESSTFIDTSAETSFCTASNMPTSPRGETISPIIGVACTTSPVSPVSPLSPVSSIMDSQFKFDMGYSLAGNSASPVSAASPPPRPKSAAPPLPLKIPAHPSSNPPPPPSREAGSPTRTASSTSLSAVEASPRQGSPKRTQTQSTISSISSGNARSGQQSLAASSQGGSTLKIVPGSNDDEEGLSPGARSPLTPNVLTKRSGSGPSGGGLLDPEALKPTVSHRQSRRLSFLGNIRGRNNSTVTIQNPDPGSQPPVPDMSAWIMTKDATQEYNLTHLLGGETVPELWNESGNVLVHLSPKADGRGPSFKVPATVIASSRILRESVSELSLGQNSHLRGRSFYGRNNLAVNDAVMAPSPILDNQTEYALYIPGPPSTQSDSTRSPVERLVAVRNMFGMLTGQPLVGTKAHPTPAAALFQVATMLEEFGYRSISGESFGEEVDVAFGLCIRSLDLTNLSSSRSGTVEALLLGEKMRSRELYDAAFAHFVGRYDTIQEIKSPLYNSLYPATREALDRAHLDLMKRLDTLNERLSTFSFPSVFAGVANSTSLEEFVTVDYRTWRMSFTRMRSLVLNHYKNKFGNWPPKASSKKNEFTKSGLNRLVLKTLYRDMCAIYDLIVDHKSLTTRVMDGTQTESSAEDPPTIKALRMLLSEYDSSSLPVVPPIPYDTPKLPSFVSVDESYESKSEKEKIRFHKNLKENEIILVMEKSYDYITPSTYPDCGLLAEFKSMELREARGKTEAEIQHQRIGHWIFMYCVIQSLPWVVVDSLAVGSTEGIEYFLCQPATGNAPWVVDHPKVRKQWYITGEGHTVELSADAVMFSTEAVYLRSHCWKMAEQWEREGLEEQDAIAGGGDALGSNITPPGSIHTESAAPSPVLRPRSMLGSPRVPSSHRSSIAIGLEPISLDDLPEHMMRSSRLSMAHNMSYRDSVHMRSHSVGPSPLQQQMADGLGPPVSGTPPFMQHSNVSGPILRGSSPLGTGMRESVYDHHAGGYINGESPMHSSPLAQSDQTATFDAILGQNDNKKKSGGKDDGKLKSGQVKGRKSFFTLKN
ncbi:choriogenin Hminor [Ceratocystis lukuohia]|uniref:Choriogenin Hminor n=1 Tax=Ceratocystis lukuohia TaxID=2019550 RepID=A0ABR4MAN3_9PEZI